MLEPVPVTLEYVTNSIIRGCNPGQFEIEIGDQVVIDLKPKNPFWPDTFVATVVAPIVRTDTGRIYNFTFDRNILGFEIPTGPGEPTPTPLPEGCDFEDVRCYSCCDALQDQIDQLGGGAGVEYIATGDSLPDFQVFPAPPFIPSNYLDPPGEAGEKLIVRYASGFIYIFTWNPEGALENPMCLSLPPLGITATSGGSTITLTNILSDTQTQEVSFDATGVIVTIS